MAFSNQEIIDKIITDLNNGMPADYIITYLEAETRKPVGESKISLNTFGQDRPNMNPWNTIGLKLLDKKQFPASERVWTKVLSLAFEQAQERYSGMPPIGAPLNNLALTFREQGRHNDALVAVIVAYIFDVITGNPGNVARTNQIHLARFSSSSHIFVWG